MYGFSDLNRNDRSLPGNADGVFHGPEGAGMDIQGYVDRAHALRQEHMARSMRTLGRSTRARLHSLATAFRSLPADMPLNRFGQSPSWF